MTNYPQDKPSCSHQHLHPKQSQPHNCTPPDCAPLTPEEFAFADHVAVDAMGHYIEAWEQKDESGTTVVCPSCIAKHAYIHVTAMVQQRRRFREQLSRPAAEVKVFSGPAAVSLIDLLTGKNPLESQTVPELLTNVRTALNPQYADKLQALKLLSASVLAFRNGVRGGAEYGTEAQNTANLFHTLDIILGDANGLEAKLATARGALQAHDDHNAQQSEKGAE